MYFHPAHSFQVILEVELEEEAEEMKVYQKTRNKNTGNKPSIVFKREPMHLKDMVKSLLSPQTHTSQMQMVTLAAVMRL